MNEILVIIDSYSSSNQILNLAVDFSVKFKSFITIAFVNQQKAINKIDDDSIYEAYYAEILEKYSDKKNISNFEYRELKGNMFNEVVKLSKQLEVDMVFMQHSIKTGFINKTFFDYSLQIQAQINCPILLVPNSYEYKGSIGKILITLDAGDDSRQKLPLTMKLAKSYKSTVHIGEAKEKGEEYVLTKFMDQSIAYLKKHNVQDISFTEFSISNYENQVSQFCDKTEIDLLIAMRNNNSDSVFKRYTQTQSLINSINVPVLSIPNVKIQRKNVGK